MAKQNNPKNNKREEKVYFTWEAAERPFKKRGREMWITSLAMLALISVILFFAKEFFLIVALFSALFMAYVLSTVPPRNILYQITNRGVKLEDNFYDWEDLSSFWFGKVLDADTLFFETKLNIPRQISLIYHPHDKDNLKKLCLQEIPLIESKPRFIDKASKWISEKVPLEPNPKVK